MKGRIFMKKEIISFPHLGDYSVPITYFLTHTTPHEIRPAPKITKQTLELGSKYSPDYVCIPFKYNLGNFIESLENGATILLQAGGGCRYGYYAEVQEKILKDLGYDFQFYSLVDSDHFTVSHMFQTFRKLNPHLPFLKFAYYALLTLLMIFYMDKLDEIIRQNIGFEKEPGLFRKTKTEMLETFSHTKGFLSLTRAYFRYKKKFQRIEIRSKENCLRVGIIGELYTAIEPFATYFLEEELAKMNIEIKRFTNVTYLLFLKKWKTRGMLRKIHRYCYYTLGADGMDNVYRAKYLIEEGFDGIIHTKPFGCTPEIGAIPIIDKVCKEEEMPIIYFSFDSGTSDTGIKTRLEAFYDMIQAKRGRE